MSAEGYINRWWRIAGGLCMNLALGAVYAWSIFVAPLEKEFGRDLRRRPAVRAPGQASHRAGECGREGHGLIGRRAVLRSSHQSGDRVARHAGRAGKSAGFPAPRRLCPICGRYGKKRLSEEGVSRLGSQDRSAAPLRRPQSAHTSGAPTPGARHRCQRHASCRRASRRRRSARSRWTSPAPTMMAPTTSRESSGSRGMAWTPRKLRTGRTPGSAAGRTRTVPRPTRR